MEKGRPTFISNQRHNIYVSDLLNIAWKMIITQYNILLCTDHTFLADS